MSWSYQQIGCMMLSSASLGLIIFVQPRFYFASVPEAFKLPNASRYRWSLMSRRGETRSDLKWDEILADCKGWDRTKKQEKKKPKLNSRWPSLRNVGKECSATQRKTLKNEYMDLPDNFSLTKVFKHLFYIHLFLLKSVLPVYNKKYKQTSYIVLRLGKEM